MTVPQTNRPLSTTDASPDNPYGTRVSRRQRIKDDVVINLLPGDKLDIFEVSAGKGQLSCRLHSMGHKIGISNFTPCCEYQDLEEHFVDMSAPDFKLPKAPFDVIICREVVEHLPNIPATLGRLADHLKPGGALILTLPNRLEIRSRVYHLMTGFYRGMRRPINMQYVMGEEHINLVGYPEMEYFLRKTGFDIKKVTCSEIDPLDHILMIFAPLCRLVSSFFLLQRKRYLKGHEIINPADYARARAVQSVLLSRPLFIGKDLVISATRL